MKVAKVEFGIDEVEIKVHDYIRDVVIYWACRNVEGIIKYGIVASGKTLKEACMNWITSDYPIDNICTNLEHQLIKDKVDIEEISACTMEDYFDAYVDSLSGEELFGMMACGEYHNYVDWSKIKSN